MKLKKQKKTAEKIANTVLEGLTQIFFFNYW